MKYATSMSAALDTLDYDDIKQCLATALEQTKKLNFNETPFFKHNGMMVVRNFAMPFYHYLNDYMDERFLDD